MKARGWEGRGSRGRRRGRAARLERVRTAAIGAVALCLLLCAAPAQAMRVISLAPSLTETVFALGAGDQLVGVSSYCDYPPEVAAIDKVGTFLTPNIEVIVAKRPDLLIAVPSPANRAPVEAMQRLGLRVLVVDPESIDGIDESIRAIAAALGRVEAGDALIARIDADLERARAPLAGVAKRRTLMVVGHSPLVAVGRGVYLDELIAMAGGENVAARAGGAWPHLSLEFVLAQAPEVIIDTSACMGVGGGAGFWRELSILPAVRDRRVHVYTDYSLLRPGPRVAQVLEAVARMIHPERFSAPASMRRFAPAWG
jgi:iron complex transport system substrate-binding protein